MPSLILILVTMLTVLYSSCVPARTDLSAWLQSRSIALQTASDLEPLMQRIGDARIVLLGEASHGTAEYYSWRAEISKRLVSEKGFRIIAVEGDWTGCAEINRYIKHRPGAARNAREALRAFQRWPRWMWANHQTAELTEWLSTFNANRSPAEQVGFYGMDVYSPGESMHAVLRYAPEHAPQLQTDLEAAYDCLRPFADDYQRYIRHTVAGGNCAEDARHAVSLLKAHAPELKKKDSEAFFRALQNAYVVKYAERHYRAMAVPGQESWNIRVEHMKGTLSRLLDFYGSDEKIIVWAHNTHIGDARATDMRDIGMQNIGALTRLRYGAENVVAVGFATHRGTVLAGSHWGAPAERMTVPPAAPGSIEHLFNQVAQDDFLLIFDGEDIPDALRARTPHRAKGVTYNPRAEQGNYVPSVVPERYDAMIFLAETNALTALDFSAPDHDSRGDAEEGDPDRDALRGPDKDDASGPSYDFDSFLQEDRRITGARAEAHASEQDTGDCPFPPQPPAASQREAERHAMVNTQIATARAGRMPVHRAEVLDAMRSVPRHVMVPDAMQRNAYADSPLPIGHGQTISQPYIVAIMTELLELSKEHRVLEIGTGSGYQAAVLAHITPNVYSMEIVKPLYQRAVAVLKEQGYDCIRLRHGDGYHGWEEHAPYDAIIVTCASGHLPPPLWKQLRKGGRIVIPIGGTHEVQRLIVVTKEEDGSRSSRTIMPVRFVPLTRSR